ncbi:DUF4362 domain-containing protein [Rossellomorea sp. GCM10028870]|uniref:DUF4362 domain-containing protein n=1 Tax=Rossellomorea sp. GCM10028870 TaxID=3273426 RepID=UPI0036084D77
MKRLMMAGLFLVLVAGCNEHGDQVEVGLGKQVADYEPAETDIVNTHGDVLNLEQFEEFYGNVKNGVEDRVRIVSYTDEGDPILHDLEFDGILIHSVRDSRQDTFGNGEIMEMTCKKIEHVEDGTMAKNMYNLADCNKNDADDSVLWY